MSEDIRGIDRWLEREGDDPGRGHGEPESKPKLVCRDCDFRGTFSNAAAHYELTGHTLLYRGVPQAFTPLEPEVRRHHARLYGTQQSERNGAA